MIENTMKNITPMTSLEKGVMEADLVIEAIVENLPTKQKLFAEVEAALSRCHYL